MKRIATVVIIAMALAAIAPAAFAATPPGHAALRSAEWNSIQLVIDDQLKALKAGDGAKAMSYAAPGLRRQFGTPERFMRMAGNPKSFARGLYGAREPHGAREG